jgi:hypothetical protein
VLYPRSLVEEPGEFLAHLVPSSTHLRYRVRAAVGGSLFFSRPHFGPNTTINFIRHTQSTSHEYFHIHFTSFKISSK